MSLYPGANLSRRYDAKYPTMTYTGGPNKGVIHTTETRALPGYRDGADAPHFTLLPILSEQRAVVYQHFDTARPSRALVNLSGGVQTGRDGVIQIELVGTCDRRYFDTYGNCILWPEAPKWALDELVKLMRWIEKDRGIKRESTKRPWVAYPKSYANGGGQRMTNSEWDNFGGWCGHQHVPENTHGDPGNIDIEYLLGTGTDPSRPRLGDRGPLVLELQKLLNARGYNLDEDGVFGPATDAALRSFQLQHALDVDGVYGPQTRAALTAAHNPAMSGDAMFLIKIDTRPEIYVSNGLVRRHVPNPDALGKLKDATGLKDVVKVEDEGELNAIAGPLGYVSGV